MRITFLGPAAAEGFPYQFCACPNCVDARAEGGPSLRMHSAALITNDLLIDLGPDLIASGMRHNLRLNAIPNTLQTHPHGDHLNSITLFARARICQVREIATMCLHCSATTVNWIDRIMLEDIADVSFRHPAVQDRLALAITEVAP
jgi:phosphoribosyl 1,2-cyclic phosphodiesterase